jgi:hypothetical protein
MKHQQNQGEEICDFFVVWREFKFEFYFYQKTLALSKRARVF